MGISWITEIRAVSSHNMKFLVAFSAIVAMAYAEADPFYGYGYAGAYGLGYHGLGYLGVGLKSAPCVNAANVPVPCAHGVGLVHYGKREAEAEADPFYGYGYAGLGYAGLYGYAHGLKSAPCVNAANVPVPCAAGGYLHYGKREADAEADAAVLYSGFGYPAYGYAGLGYAGLGYAAPAVVAAAPAVVAAAPAAVVQNAVLGTADLPNPVHAVAHTLLGTVHSSHIGVCTNYLGEQVDC